VHSDSDSSDIRNRCHGRRHRNGSLLLQGHLQKVGPHTVICFVFKPTICIVQPTIHNSLLVYIDC